MKTAAFAAGFEPERYELDEPGRSRWIFPRRQFFKTLGAGVLVVLFTDSAKGQESGTGGTTRRTGGGGGGGRPQELGAWLHIDDQGKVTVFTGKVEVGQNIRTTLTQIVSEELKTPISSIRLVMADTQLTPFDAGTFGSRSTPDMGSQLRKVAATAREVLFDLSAEQWKTDKAGYIAKEGKIWNGDKSFAYGELTKGQKLTARVNDKAPVTTPDQWKVAGTSVLKVNGRDIVTGKHRYTIDQKIPGMLHAKILRPPSFGAILQSLDDSAAKAMPGVEVYRDQNFVGVLAPDEWTARKGMLALRTEWKQDDQKISNQELFQSLRATSNAPAPELTGAAGDPLELHATYTVAYIAHAPLEPRGAVAEWKADAVTVWTGTQRPFGVRGEVAKALNMPEEKVRIVVPDTGSGYGGKHTGEAAVEAARLAQFSKKSVKLIWTREEEFTWAYFRPAGVMDIRSAVNTEGKLQKWEHHNFNSGNSGIQMLYQVSQPKTVFHNSKSPLRQGSYRGLAATANHFARESHMDELAAAVKMDPLEFRLKNATEPRVAAVLNAAAKVFGWPGKKTATSACGIAAGSEKGSFLATCAEVEIDSSKKTIRVVRVVQAFECGAVVNPDQLKNQNEGAILMGIGGALWEQMDFADGKIINPRFSEYPVPRFRDAPVIEIVLVNRLDIPSVGAGETPIVGIAPAIANAVASATGKRLRDMPLTLV